MFAGWTQSRKRSAGKVDSQEAAAGETRLSLDFRRNLHRTWIAWEDVPGIFLHRSSGSGDRLRRAHFILLGVPGQDCLPIKLACITANG